MLKVLRITAGLALLVSATGFLIEGGLSRYARFGIPARPNWRLIAIGLVMAGMGGFLVRPVRLDSTKRK
jgi:hypothetical protein